MPDDAKIAIMASRVQVASLALVGSCIIGVGIYNAWLVGRWGYTAGLTTIALACVLSVYVYRLVRYPLIVFKNNMIDIIAYPLSRTTRIALKDIKDVCRSYHEAKITLVDDKKIYIPISFMKRSDCEFILTEIKKKTKGHVGI